MQSAFSGAVVRRVIDRSGAVVPEHAHDWPVLSLFVMGGYLNQSEAGDAFIAGPSAVLYRPGAGHRNAVADLGFEQIEIEFDPAWLGGAMPAAPVSRWIGGRVAAEARSLARLCAEGGEEASLRTALQQFLAGADRAPGPDAAAWTAEVGRRLRADPGVSVRDLAREAGRHPAWLGTGYRRATGESLAAAAARFRVERAACLLRETDLTPAQVAADAGFCDQSHMSRSFRRLLGRLPSQVRADRCRFRDEAPKRRAP
jgi:AraC-like DNA-binding protein